MTTFVYIPDYGAKVDFEPVVRSVKFLDGYEQRVTYGLNTNLQKWTLEFTARTDNEINNIVNFLNARNGVESFNWTTPDGISGRKWICRTWQKTMIAFNINSVNATFEEVLD